MDKIPLRLLFTMLNAPISFSFSYKRCFCPLIIFFALHGTSFTVLSCNGELGAGVSPPDVSHYYWTEVKSTAFDLLERSSCCEPSLLWGHTAGSRSACLPGPSGPTWRSCFPVIWPPAHTGAWCSSKGTGLCTSLLLHFMSFTLFSACQDSS